MTQHEEQPNRLHVLRLAAAAGCDPRTARAYLEGREIRGELLRARIEEAAQTIIIPRAAPKP